MIDYLCYVKKQYSKEKDYEKFLTGLAIFMLYQKSHQVKIKSIFRKRKSYPHLNQCG